MMSHHLNGANKQDGHKYSQLKIQNISNTDISNHSISQRIYFGHIFYLHVFTSQSFYLKLLISQSKFSGIRKFTLTYQWFRMNFEISRVECNIVFK